jgi:hypothetical protein
LVLTDSFSLPCPFFEAGSIFDKTLDQILEKAMTLLKVIEFPAGSDQSWEDAARRAVEMASQSVRNTSSIRINASTPPCLTIRPDFIA